MSRQIYALCLKDSGKIEAYYWDPPYDILKRNIDTYNLRIWTDDVPVLENVSVDIPDPAWKPFHGIFSRRLHLYAFIGREAANRLEVMDALGQLNEPLEKTYDCSEVWDSGTCVTPKTKMIGLQKHLLAVAGFDENSAPKL